LIVFINARSGGQVGPHLFSVLSKALGAGQVFDVGEDKPGKVLKTLWKNLKSTATDPIASNILCNLRILVAGGDGTVVWVLGEIAKLGLTPAPAVAVMPLGTGNDLALSFGWGNKFLPGLINQPTSLYKTLKTYADAQVRVLDQWMQRLHIQWKASFGIISVLVWMRKLRSDFIR
jgi:diacylglycerol kinase (ATP)